MPVSHITIPSSIPHDKRKTFTENMHAITHKSTNLFLFACDQKIEHLNDDFYGENISLDALYPEHLFRIASQGTIGAMAVPLGLLSRYGNLYPDINYIVKLNGKTNLIPTEDKEPFSNQLWSINDVIQFKETSKTAIRGVGITLYAGSQYEDVMLKQTAQTVLQAHQHGLVTVVWIYPRGKAIEDDTATELVAGIAGIAHALGADFVKVKSPKERKNITIAQQLRIATTSAGNTGVICSGGASKDPQTFLKELYTQIQEGNTRGCATGRNIFQKSLKEAIAMTNAIASLVYYDADAEGAWLVYNEKKDS